MERNALGLTKKRNAIREKLSNVASKATELQHIKSVELKRHTAHTCPLKNVSTLQIPLAISILRVELRNETICMGRQSTCLEDRKCPLSRGLTPAKLVIITNTRRNPICLDRFNDRQIVNHVTLLEYCRSGYYPQIEFKSKAKRLFVILSHLTTARPRTTVVIWGSGHSMACLAWQICWLEAVDSTSPLLR